MKAFSFGDRSYDLLRALFFVKFIEYQTCFYKIFARVSNVKYNNFNMENFVFSKANSDDRRPF